MSAEIIVSLSLSVSKGSTSDALALKSVQFDMIGSSIAKFRQEIGITQEPLHMGVDIDIPGWFMAINRDPTNYVQMRAGSGFTDLVKIPPGAGALFMFSEDAIPHAVANTAPCEVEILLIET